MENGESFYLSRRMTPGRAVTWGPVAIGDKRPHRPHVTCKMPLWRIHKTNDPNRMNDKSKTCDN